MNLLRTMCFFLTLWICNPVYTQQPALLYNIGASYYRTQDYESAIEVLSRYTERTEYDSLYPRALMYLAESYKAIGEYEQALNTYQEILNTDFKAHEQLFTDTFMYGVYDNYPYNSMISLAEIYLILQDHAKAKMCLDSVESMYLGFYCHSAYVSSDKYRDYLYARYFEAMGLIDSAIQKMVPVVFENTFEVASREQTNYLLALFEHKYGALETRKMILDTAGKMKYKVMHEDTANNDLFVFGKVDIFGHELVCDGALSVKRDKMAHLVLASR